MPATDRGHHPHTQGRRLGRAVSILSLAALAALAAGQAPAAGRAVATTASKAAPSQPCRAALPPRPGGDLTCNRPGGPESFREQADHLGQLQSRSTAPFRTLAPGAYTAAVQQRTAVAGPGAVPGSGGTWKQVGGTPECAGPSTSGSVCPPASAANGNYPVGPLGEVQLGGRMTSFAADPSNAQHLWVSGVAGGVFETTDGATTWHSVGDGLPTQVVGAIAYDAPTHTLLVGTGDNSFGGDGISGHGIYLSSDDGASWTQAAGVPDLALSFRIVVSPVDTTGKTIYAATSKGLFRSTDGGASFVNLRLPTTPAGYSPNCAGDTTTPVCFFASIVTDVVVHPAASSNGPAGAVMAVVGWRAGAKPDKDASGNPLECGSVACVQAPQNGIYTSTSGDPGTFSWASGASNGYAPDNIAGRTALAGVTGAGQTPDAVYSLVEDVQKFNGCPDLMDTVSPICQGLITAEGAATVLDGLYASYDFGKTWLKIMDWTQLRGAFTNSALTAEVGYAPGVQAWYNLNLAVDPTTKDGNNEPTRLVFGLEELWENNTGPVPTTGGNPLHTGWQQQKLYGETPGDAPWVVIGRYWNACAGLNTGVPCNPSNLSDLTSAVTTTHPDQHAEIFVPDGSGGVSLFAGSDGGVFKQHVAQGSNFDNQSWGDGNNIGLKTQQPYDAEMAKDGTVVSGLQDNGEDKITPDGHQYEIFGGDGFYTTIDPNNSSNILEEYTYGVVSGTNDGGSHWFFTDFTDPSGSSACSSSTALFATPIEQDPTLPGHVVIGCSQVQEATAAYTNTCLDPTCDTYQNNPFVQVFDLGTEPSGANNVPSAVGVRGANVYIGYCGYCDVVTGGLPFRSGIATNVGGSQPPQTGTGNGWHFAAGNCSNCGTPDGKLPQRYITSVQMDPSDPSTVYVTMGGYGRRWIPPGALGDPVSEVGNGHVFKSTDHGENFTDISGNLPDAPANWTLLHNGQLVVATDVGMFISDPATSVTSLATGTGGLTFGVLGSGLPVTPAFTVRQSPADPNTLLISTFGRGDYLYTFPATTTATSQLPTTAVTPPLPNTAGAGTAAEAGVAGAGVLSLLAVSVRRRRHARRRNR